MQNLHHNVYIMGEKFNNRLGNTALIPGRIAKTGVLGFADVINTTAGVFHDALSVIINTNNKIAELFSDDLVWRKQGANIPAAIGVGLAGVGEFFAKPIANGVVNTGKTAVNLVTNARKSTFGSLFTTNPVSDIRFNTIKWRGNPIRLDTRKGILSTEELWTKNLGYMPEDAELARLREKNREIQARIAKLTRTP